MGTYWVPFFWQTLKKASYFYEYVIETESKNLKIYILKTYKIIYENI